MVPWVLGFLSSCPPSEGGSLVSSDRRVGLAGLRRTSGLVFQSLCTLPTWPWPGLSGFGVFMFGCSVALLPGASAVSFAFVMLTWLFRTSLAPRLAGFTVPARQRENNRMGDRFNLWERSGFPGLLGAPHRLTVRAVLVCPRL